MSSTSTTLPQPAQPARYAPGDKVEIVGLVKRPDLNGRVGVIDFIDCASGDIRLAIYVDGNKIKLEPSNTRLFSRPIAPQRSQRRRSDSRRNNSRRERSNSRKQRSNSRRQRQRTPSCSNDRDGGRHRGRDGRKGKSGDDLGRNPKLAAMYREKAVRGELERSRSRSGGSADKAGSSRNGGEEQIKVVHVDFSADWEVVMSKKFEDLRIAQDEWDMTAFDRQGKKIQLDAEVVQINEDSFPLQFKFVRREREERIVKIEFSEHWENVMTEKFTQLGLKQDEWDMVALDRNGKKLEMDGEDCEITPACFPIQFKFIKKV